MGDISTAVQVAKRGAPLGYGDAHPAVELGDSPSFSSKNDARNPPKSLQNTFSPNTKINVQKMKGQTYANSHYQFRL